MPAFRVYGHNAREEPRRRRSASEHGDSVRSLTRRAWLVGGISGHAARCEHGHRRCNGCHHGHTLAAHNAQSGL